MSLPFHLAQPIRTERLVLRPFEERDLDALCDLQARPEVARYLYWEPRNRRQSRASLKSKMGRTQIAKGGDALNLAVTVSPDDRLIGDVMLMYPSTVHHQAELGYLFAPAVRGHGYATEAATALVDLAITALEVHRVYARLDGRNDRSARLLERVGLRREAHLVENEWVKGEWTDELVYAVLATEWAARPPAARPSN
jgi:RimJ/RimL family protein N-acetyltransferase